MSGKIRIAVNPHDGIVREITILLAQNHHGPQFGTLIESNALRSADGPVQRIEMIRKGRSKGKKDK